MKENKDLSPEKVIEIIEGKLAFEEDDIERRIDFADTVVATAIFDIFSGKEKSFCLRKLFLKDPDEPDVEYCYGKDALRDVCRPIHELVSVCRGGEHIEDRYFWCKYQNLVNQGLDQNATILSMAEEKGWKDVVCRIKHYKGRSSFSFKIINQWNSIRFHFQQQLLMLQVGSDKQPFEIAKQLGSTGAFASTYLAHPVCATDSTKKNIPSLAVKLLNKTSAEAVTMLPENVYRRARWEATSASVLYRHTHALFKSAQKREREKILIVMEAVPGKPLYTFSISRLTLRQRASILAQVSFQLNFLHSASHPLVPLRHGDVASRNVVVSLEWDDARAHLVDFGLAKYCGAKQEIDDFYRHGDADELKYDKRNFFHEVVRDLKVFESLDDIFPQSKALVFEKVKQLDMESVTVFFARLNQLAISVVDFGVNSQRTGDLLQKLEQLVENSSSRLKHKVIDPDVIERYQDGNKKHSTNGLSLS